MSERVCSLCSLPELACRAQAERSSGAPSPCSCDDATAPARGSGASARVLRSRLDNTVQLDCDLATLTSKHAAEDVKTLLSSELDLAPESAPSATTLTLPCLSFDPDDKLGLSKFSSFTPPSFQHTSKYTPENLKRRRLKKEAYAEAQAKRARTEAAVQGSTALELSSATLSKNRRVGYAGVAIKMENLPRSSPKAQAPGRFLPTPPASPPNKISPVDSPISSTSFYAASPPLTPSSEDSPPPASTAERDRASVEAHLVKLHPTLAGYTFSHRTGTPGQAVTFVDSSRRAFATRIERPEAFDDLIDEFGEEIAGATATIPPFKTDGVRGDHEIRQIGVHRESGAVEPVYSQQFTKSPKKWLNLMNGKAFGRVRGHISRCLQTHYPAVYEYHRTLATSLASRGLHFLFGAFCSWCLNLGGRVACRPHRDKHNLGPGLCGVMPFGRFKSYRSGWLVLEEARLVIELSALDVALFPSAIFTHWNTAVHHDDERESLAAWGGASLFLWSELGGRSLSRLSAEEQARVYAENKSSWLKAWDRFPVL